MWVFATRLSIHGTALRRAEFSHQSLQVLQRDDCVISLWASFGLFRKDMNLGWSWQQPTEGMKSMCRKKLDIEVVIDVDLEVRPVRAEQHALGDNCLSRSRIRVPFFASLFLICRDEKSDRSAIFSARSPGRSSTAIASRFVKTVGPRPSVSAKKAGSKSAVTPNMEIIVSEVTTLGSSPYLKRTMRRWSLASTKRRRSCVTKNSADAMPRQRSRTR